MDLIVNQNKNVEEATCALDSKVRQYSQLLAESYYLQNVRGKNNNFFNFQSYITKAHSGLLSFLKSQSFIQDDPDILLRGLYQGQVPTNTPFKPTNIITTTASTTNINNATPTTNFNNKNASQQQQHYYHQSVPTSGSNISSSAVARSDTINKFQHQQQQQHSHHFSNINNNNSNSLSNNNNSSNKNVDGSSYHQQQIQHHHHQQHHHHHHHQNKTTFGVGGGPGSVVGTGSNSLDSSSTNNTSNKKFSEKMKAEASIVQRISELQKEGMWYDKRLPKAHEAPRNKTHWDYLLEEMAWLAADFASERKWKRIASRRCAKMVEKYFNDKEAERIRAEKEEELKLRRLASFIAKEINNFWSNAQRLVEYKEQSRIEEIKKQALDQQLSYIVDQTEKYSSMLAESFITDNNTSSIMDDSTRLDDSIEASHKSSNGISAESTLSDDEFEPDLESGEDDEETIAKAEEDAKDVNTEIAELQRESQMSLDDFLDELPAEYIADWKNRHKVVDEPSPPTTAADAVTATTTATTTSSSPIAVTPTTVASPPTPSTPLNDTLEKPSALPPDKTEDKNVTSVLEEESKEHKTITTATTTKPISENEDTTTISTSDDVRKNKVLNEALDAVDSAVESESEQGTDLDAENDEEGDEEDEEVEGSDDGESDSGDRDSEYEEEEEDVEPDDEEQTVGLASLLQTFAPERAGEDHEDDALNSVAAMAESFQPKGYTLSSTTVVTKVPFLLKHTLREYQHIGLDWLVTMHEKKLNGILADEMGLGKTIQTIALLAHLACEKGNWGPHLIVVPTSVMLNWEMEFKKWCPGFKILTYYGSIKERRLKRTGWTKPNAFHVCITSYKLVIQDHASFRRKRWKYLILDEAQNIKNFKSQRWQLLLNFATHRRLLLTGTPLQNNLMELWSLMHFLMPNVFQSHREFREWFSNPVTGMVEGNSEYNENIIRRLHKVLRPFILRRLKSEVEKQLPQKYEHVVPCRLSKRQRYLYEDFMSRTKTKETLASGNLLSVINVLMQLRKVCNHPNLFESRPVISPYQTEGLTYTIPSIIWNMLALQDLENSTRAIFRMSLADLRLSKYEANRIGELKPPGEEQFSQTQIKQESTMTNVLSPSNSNTIQTSSPSKRKHSADGDENAVDDITEYDYVLQTTVVNTLPDGNIRCAPKKRRFLKWCADDYAVPAPKTKIPIPFFLMNVDPTPYLEDESFVESGAASKPFQIQVTNDPTIPEEKFEALHKIHSETSAPVTKFLTEVSKPRKVGRPSKSEMLKRASTTSSLTENENTSSSRKSNDTTGVDYENENDDENFQGEDESDSDDEDFSMYSAEDAGSKVKARKRKRRRAAKNKKEKEAKRIKMAGGTDADGNLIFDEDSRVDHDEDDEEDDDDGLHHEGRGTEFDSIESKDENLEDNESDVEGSIVSSEDDENLVKRNKIRFAPEQSIRGLQWARAVGLNPIEFQEAEVQARSIQNRRALIDRLQFINDKRCEIIPVMGADTIEQCRILGQLPKMRYYGTRVRHLGIKYKGRSVKRDYKHNAYFHRGYEEVCSISTIKNSEEPRLKNHPLIIWRHTKALTAIVMTLDELLEIFSPIIKRFILYVPAVSSSLISSRIVRPNPSKYLQQINMEQELREFLRKPSQILHPIISSMATQFPDPKLIQYDCGKLQALDSLLRKLKAGNHRILIFTQMAKMLDILEVFLNCHGYIYLRLDGATRIDQRQLLMEKFNSDTRIFCFILSTRSGGIGVNLTGADTVIFYDSDWNPTMDAQAQDRCHRIGQTRDVHIYRLVSEKTIEENILKKSNQKRLLGELAINDGNFTTAFFAKQSIRDLFEVRQDKPDTVQRRLEAITTGQPFVAEESQESEKTVDATPASSEKSMVVETISEDVAKVGPPLTEVDKNQIQLFETALAQAEDEMDVQATRTVKAEAAAELAEFDESIPLEDLGDGQEMVESSMIDLEMKSIEAELSAVERYALRFMENTIDDWSTETVAQAQKEMEQQKREWELEQLRKSERESLSKSMNGGDMSDEDDLLTYSSSDAHNQVWISHGREEVMPLWAPPTPPQDEDDVYFDCCHGFLYDYNIIPESLLPPVYSPPKKEKKSHTTGLSLLPPKVSPTPPTVTPEEEERFSVSGGGSISSHEKKPKIPRRDEPIFAPRSLFDRPSPQMAKLRRDYKLQKFNLRPVVTTGLPLAKPTLGPGAITFPVVHPSTKAPSPPPQHESVEWMIAEDYALLQTVQNILELPLSLLVVSLAQTPNWDLAAEMVNLNSRTYRTPKQCKLRYETTVGPREEGKLLYEQPVALKQKKKVKGTFIKLSPPSPSKAGRVMKISQLISSDNNSQLLNTFVGKFDACKHIANKRPAVSKPMTLNPHMKSNKQSTIFTEHGINFDSPLPATSIAQARHERLILERKKAIAQQQAASAVAQASGGASTGTAASHPVTTAALAAAIASASPNANQVVSQVVGASPVQSTQPQQNLAQASAATASTIPVSSVASSSPSASDLTASQKAKIQNSHIVLNQTPQNQGITEPIRRVAPTSTGQQKRQYALLQHQTQLQQQLQILHQQQNQQKQQQIQIQLAQPGQQQSTIQGSTTGQQVIISSPSSASAKSAGAMSSGSAIQLSGGQKQVILQGHVLQQQQQQQSIQTTTGQTIQLQAGHQQQSGIVTFTQAVSQATGQPQKMTLSQSQPIQIQLPVSAGQQQQQFTPSTIVSSSGQVIQVSQSQIGSKVQNTPATQIVSSIASKQHQQGGQQVIVTGGGGMNVVSHSQTQQQQSASGHQQAPKQVTVVLPQGFAALNVAGSQSQPINQIVNSSQLTGLLQSKSGSSVPVVASSTGSSATTTALTASSLSRTPQILSQQVGLGLTGQQQGRTVTMQLVKQHTVGGKTVTRQVTDAEVAAFLKQHGMTTTTLTSVTPTGSDATQKAKVAGQNSRILPVVLSQNSQNPGITELIARRVIPANPVQKRQYALSQQQHPQVQQQLQIIQPHQIQQKQQQIQIQLSQPNQQQQVATTSTIQGTGQQQVIISSPSILNTKSAAGNTSASSTIHLSGGQKQVILQGHVLQQQQQQSIQTASGQTIQLQTTGQQQQPGIVTFQQGGQQKMTLSQSQPIQIQLPVSAGQQQQQFTPSTIVSSSGQVIQVSQSQIGSKVQNTPATQIVSSIASKQHQQGGQQVIVTGGGGMNVVSHSQTQQQQSASGHQTIQLQQAPKQQVVMAYQTQQGQQNQVQQKTQQQQQQQTQVHVHFQPQGTGGGHQTMVIPQNFAQTLNVPGSPNQSINQIVNSSQLTGLLQSKSGSSVPVVASSTGSSATTTALTASSLSRTPQILSQQVGLGLTGQQQGRTVTMQVVNKQQAGGGKAVMSTVSTDKTQRLDNNDGIKKEGEKK